MVGTGERIAMDGGAVLKAMDIKKAAPNGAYIALLELLFDRSCYCYGLVSRYC